MQSFFVVGTDTNCGKTFVTLALIDALQVEGKRAHAIKPIASGAVYQSNGKLVSEDVHALSSKNKFSLPVNHWLYEPPVSPHLMNDPTLTANAVSVFCMQDCFSCCDVLLVEGAGGLMVPLNQKETWIDVLKILKIPVILIVGMRLGCLNHALLTATALRQAEIPSVGWIANQVEPNMLRFEANVETLIERMPMPFITTVMHCGRISPSFKAPWRNYANL